eukprot:c9234_g2_i1 orf=2-199(-)
MEISHVPHPIYLPYLVCIPFEKHYISSKIFTHINNTPQQHTTTSAAQLCSTLPYPDLTLKKKKKKK